MKNILKVSGICLFVLMFVFAITTCSDPGGGTGTQSGEEFVNYPPTGFDPAVWNTTENAIADELSPRCWIWEIAAGKGHFVAVGGIRVTIPTATELTLVENWLVKRSVDGMRWTDVKGPFDREVRTVVYGAGTNGVGTFVAADVGDFESGYNTPDRPRPGSSGEVSRRSSIFYSRDDGATWTRSTFKDGTPMYAQEGLWSILSLVHGKDGTPYGTWLALAQYGSVAKSTDGGVTWEKIVDGEGRGIGLSRTLVSNRELEAAYIDLDDPNLDPNTIYPAFRTGVYVPKLETWYIAGDFGVFASSADLVDWDVTRSAYENESWLYTPYNTDGTFSTSYFMTKIICIEEDGILALHAVGSNPSQYVILNNPSTNNKWEKGDSNVLSNFQTNDASCILAANDSIVIVGSGGRAAYRSVQGGSYYRRWQMSSTIVSGQAWIRGLAYAGGVWVAGVRGGLIAFADVRFGDE